MQIRDLRHKHRLIIKATDVVLFGPPQRTNSFICFRQKKKKEFIRFQVHIIM